MFPFGLLAFVRFADDRFEWLREAGAELLVVGDLQSRVESLICQAAGGVAGSGVGVLCVGEQPETVVEERPRPGVVLVVLKEALLDVCKPGTDAVLVPLHRGQVDRVGEVRSQESVALGFEPGAVGGEVSELLIPCDALLIERGIDFGGEVTVVGLTDRDAPVGW